MSDFVLGEEFLMDHGHAATPTDLNSSEDLRHLFITPDGQLQMSGGDGLLLFCGGDVTGLLKNLLHEVLHHGSQEGGTGRADSLSDTSLLHQTAASAYLEQKSSFLGPGGLLLFRFNGLGDGGFAWWHL